VQYLLRKSLHGLLLILGVTLVSFILMVWFGPEQTYTLICRANRRTAPPTGLRPVLPETLR
jgi:hypothetical protein